ATLAADADFRSAGQRLQARLDQPAGVIAQLHRAVAIAGQRQPDDGRGVRLDLVDDRLVDVFGQTATRTRDPVAHIARRRVRIAFQAEAQRDLTLLRSADGAHDIDTFDAGQL